MSKTLYPKQVEALRFFLHRLRAGDNTLDQSDMGTGKTVVGVKIAKALGRPLVIICPKAVIPAWKQELAEDNITATFILNLEALRTGKSGYVTKVGKKTFRWLLDPNTVVFVDEIHKCKGPFTQNAGLLISLVKQGYTVHGMSGTSCEDPTEMRPLGLMLGLHSGDEKVDGLKRWWPWMRMLGCEKNEWGSWVLEDPFHLPQLRQQMYSTSTHRLTTDDFPTSFKDNRVFTVPIQFRENKKIVKAYESLGITPQIIEDFIEKGTVTDSDHVLANITRARQLAESFKVIDLAEMAEDLMANGKSVVLFVNYSDTIDALRLRLKCDRIDGRQSDAVSVGLRSFKPTRVIAWQSTLLLGARASRSTTRLATAHAWRSSLRPSTARPTSRCSVASTATAGRVTRFRTCWSQRTPSRSM